MYRTKKMHEVESMVKNKMEHDLSLDQFATISGIKGKQFGKDVFTTVLPFKDLVKFLQVFENVQREMNQAKVNKIKRYTLSGVEDENMMRFFPGITVTARGHIFYDEHTNKLAVDTKNSKLSVNDGQHRFMGINASIMDLQSRINKTKDKQEKEELTKTLNELKDMVLPIVIFSQLTEEEEKQLFSDTNNLASRPSRSATIRLEQNDLLSVLARELSESNRYLTHYGVEFDKGSIQKKNPNRILLTTVYASLKLIYKEHLKHNRQRLTRDSYDDFYKDADTTFNKIFQSLPADMHIPDKYILDKSYSFKGIAAFISYCRDVIKVEDEDVIWDTISKVNWKLDVDYWKKYNGVQTKRGKLSFGGSGDHGRVAVFDALTDLLPKKVLNQAIKQAESKKLKVKEPEALEGQASLFN